MARSSRISIRKGLRHLRKQILRGFLAAIPFVLSYLVLRFLYKSVDLPITEKIHELLGFRIPGLGIVLLVVALYLLGLLSTRWAGRKALAVLERVARRIPLVKSVYQVGKQVSSTLSLPEQQAFKRVVMTEFFKPGVWSVGFVTGEVRDKDRPRESLLKVFIPTAPNPTTGFLVMVKESQVREIDWDAQDTINAVVSAGIIGPKEVGGRGGRRTSARRTPT